MDKEKLYRFFEGNVTVEEGMEIRDWMEASAENKRIFMKEHKLFSAILLQDKRRIAAVPGKSRLRTILKSDWLRVAAIALITLSLNAVYQHYVADNKELAMSIVSVPAGQRTNVTLPDGTNVWLNARTTIRFPEKFSTRTRTVELMGEGYFDVVKDKERPFIVKTDKYSIEVLGTKFDVEAYPDEEKFVTTLMQGSVKLTSQASPSHQVTLKPEHKATLKDGRLEVSKVTDFNPYRWKEGLISFKDEPFLTIMKDLEKYYGFKIIINNQDVLKYSYTGSFRQTDGVDYALRVLQNDISFSYKKDNETQIIHIN